MDLSPTITETSYADDRRWEGSKHGKDCTRSVTLDVKKFDDVGLVFTDQAGVKRVKSGTAIRKSGTLYVPVDELTVVVGANNDTWAQNATCNGHLEETVIVKSVADGAHAAGSLRWHGVVVTAQIPRPLETNAGTPAKFDTDSAAFDTAKGAKHVLYV